MSATSPLWFITRGTGVTALILLTLTLVLGIAGAVRLQAKWLPRFVLEAVHRNAALLAVVFLAVHVATTVLDGYVRVSWLNALVPFSSAYKPLWVGLGAVSVDLLLAVLVTSLLRRRIGYRAWRATHWLAYASWPVAMFHSIGIGTDAGTAWMRIVAAVCAMAVVAAVGARLSDRRPVPRTRPRQGRPARRPLSSLASGGGR